MYLTCPYSYNTNYISIYATHRNACSTYLGSITHKSFKLLFGELLSSNSILMFIKCTLLVYNTEILEGVKKQIIYFFKYILYVVVILNYYAIFFYLLLN